MLKVNASGAGTRRCGLVRRQATRSREKVGGHWPHAAASLQHSPWQLQSLKGVEHRINPLTMSCFISSGQAAQDLLAFILSSLESHLADHRPPSSSPQGF